MNRLETFTTDAKRAYILIASLVGLLAAGAAPALLFGYSLYSALVTSGWTKLIAAIPGGALGVTMEVIGALSAYIAQYTKSKQAKAIAIGVLSAYTLTGLVYMAGYELNPIIKRTGFMAYWVSPMLYICVALLTATLKQEAEREEGKAILLREREENRIDTRQKEQDEIAWQRQQQAIKEQREHEAKLEQMRLTAEVNKTKATAKQQQSNILETLQMVAQQTQRPQPHTKPLTPKQQAMANNFQPGISPTELARKAGVDKSTASRYITNGAMKHWQLTNGGGEQ